MAPAAIAESPALSEPLIAMIGIRARLRVLAQAPAVEEPVDPGKPDVEHHGVGRALEQEPVGLDDVVSLVYRDALELEGLAYELAERDVVVDDENVERFHWLPPVWRPVASSEGRQTRSLLKGRRPNVYKESLERGTVALAGGR